MYVHLLSFIAEHKERKHMPAIHDTLASEILCYKLYIRCSASAGACV